MPRGSKRPNVLVLISDDTDPAYLGPYGGPYPTPNFDWLSREGVRFTKHDVVAPICTPSRYAYLTGQLPSRCPSPNIHRPQTEDEFQLIGFESEIRPSDQHAATIFKHNGYATGYVGKFHCGRQADELGMHHIPSGSTAEEADRLRRENHALAVEELHRIGWDYADSIAWGNIDWEPWISLDAHNLEWTTDGALRFLRSERDNAQPFFLTVATNVIHGPKHADNIVDQDTRITPAGTLEQPPQTGHPSRRSIVERLHKEGIEPTHRAVGAVWLDDCLGVLRNELERLGELDNTIIIYQSDHSVFGKSSCHVSGSRTGFLARWPERIPAGSICSHPVQNIDFLPTLVDLLELETPAEPSFDGKSYAAVLLGQPYVGPAYWYNEVGVARSVQTKEFKYIAFRYQQNQIETMQDDPERRVMNQIGRWDPWMPEFYHRHYWEPDQLYRIDHDEWEQINLASFPRYAPILQQMKELLRYHLESIGQSFPEEPHPFQSSDEFRERVATRMQTAIDGLEYFHTGGW